MESRTCERCGGPNSAGASVCQWCGAALPLPGSGPSPPPLAFSDGTAPPRIVELPPPLPAAPSGPSLSPGAIVALVVVVIMVLLFVAMAASLSSSMSPIPPGGPPGTPAVDVTNVDLSSGDNACGMSGAVEPGFFGVGGSIASVSWAVNPPYTCTIRTVTAVTPGFQVLGSNVPLSAVPGGGENLSVTIQLPAGGFYGSLALDVE